MSRPITMPAIIKIVARPDSHVPKIVPSVPMFREFNAGYSLGTSNAAKTQYWIIQSRQREDQWFNKSHGDARYKYYSFPGEKYAPDGTKLVEHDIILKVIE